MLKKVLFVPGFLRKQRDVERAERIVAKLQPIFQKSGWDVVASDCYKGKPSTASIYIYAMRLAEEIRKIRPDAIVAHSMGTLILRESWKFVSFDGPMVFIEGPNMGSPLWKLVVTRFSPFRDCVQDMVRGSLFMESLGNFPRNNPVLEVHGKLALSWIAKDIFKQLPYSQLATFPKVGHVELVTDPGVIDAVLKFLNATAKGP